MSQIIFGDSAKELKKIQSNTFDEMITDPPYGYQFMNLDFDKAIVPVEIIIVAMKPLSEKNYYKQALANGHGITWLDNCRIPYINNKDIGNTDRGKGYPILDPKKGWNDNSIINNITIGEKGRFPANLLVSNDSLNDGKITSGGKFTKSTRKGLDSWRKMENRKNMSVPIETIDTYGDSGSFSRYFDIDKWYESQFIITPKASKSEKNKGLENFSTKQSQGGGGGIGQYVNDVNSASGKYGSEKAPAKNNHPTVKPIKLMSYLISLGSRNGDHILDPFAGSGTTGLACIGMNRNYTLIEKDEQYYSIIKSRIANQTQKLECFI